VLAYIDGFMIIGFAVIGMLLLRSPAGEPDAAARSGCVRLRQGFAVDGPLARGR
jgi:hypothetical protein